MLRSSGFCCCVVFSSPESTLRPGSSHMCEVDLHTGPRVRFPEQRRNPARPPPPAARSSRATNRAPRTVRGAVLQFAASHEACCNSVRAFDHGRGHRSVLRFIR